MVGCIALKDSGDLIAGMETGIFSLHLGDAQSAVAEKLASPAGLREGMRRGEPISTMIDRQERLQLVDNVSV